MAAEGILNKLHPSGNIASVLADIYKVDTPTCPPMSSVVSYISIFKVGIYNSNLILIQTDYLQCKKIIKLYTKKTK